MPKHLPETGVTLPWKRLWCRSKAPAFNGPDWYSMRKLTPASSHPGCCTWKRASEKKLSNHSVQRLTSQQFICIKKEKKKQNAKTSARSSIQHTASRTGNWWLCIQLPLQEGESIELGTGLPLRFQASCLPAALAWEERPEPLVTALKGFIQGRLLLPGCT